MGRLQGKVAVVTGGARGIGAATVRRFVEEGARVASFDMIDGEAMEGVTHHRVDVSDEASVSAAMETVRAAHGRLDILVNNAAITGVNKPTHEVSVADWDAIFAVNVRGVFLCTKHAIPAMIARKDGAIVNFSSIYGLIGNDDLPPYHATKGAVLMMTKTDAILYAPHGIRVNAVHPGSTKTELFMKAADTYVHGRDAYLAMMAEKHPLRLGEPVDVANCVLFLASDEARFVTGTSLVCDGGYTAQ